jgi:hypothetical protein
MNADRDAMIDDELDEISTALTLNVQIRYESRLQRKTCVEADIQKQFKK